MMSIEQGAVRAVILDATETNPRITLKLAHLDAQGGGRKHTKATAVGVSLLRQFYIPVRYRYRYAKLLSGTRAALGFRFRTSAAISRNCICCVIRWGRTLRWRPRV